MPLGFSTICLIAEVAATATPPSVLSMVLNSTMLWLLAGSILCLTELFVPTAFVAFVMGLSAFAVAAVSLTGLAVNLQILLWMGFATAGVFLSRRLLPHRLVRAIEDATEAETLTEISPGQAGRVLYEGNSWRARCDDRHMAILPNQKVYVLRREGTTLIVVPENFLHS